MLELFDFRDSSDTLGYLWGLVFEYQAIVYLDLEKMRIAILFLCSIRIPGFHGRGDV